MRMFCFALKVKIVANRKSIKSSRQILQGRSLFYQPASQPHVPVRRRIGAS